MALPPDPAGRDAFRWVHLFALALVAIGLSWGNFLMSLGQLVLVGNLLIEGAAKHDLGARARRAFTSAPVLVFVSFYALHLVGLLWTTDLQWGLDLCRILAPVVVLAVALAATEPLHVRELRALLLLAAWGTVASTAWCGTLAGVFDPTVDYRSLACSISHIRLALLLCMAIVIFMHHWPREPLLRIAHLAGAAWSLYYIVRLGSIAGAVILIVVAIYAVWLWSSRGSGSRRWMPRALVVLVPLMAVVYAWSCWRDFHHVQEGRNNTYLTATAGGERYHHDPMNPQRENGWYVWRNIAELELRRVWTRRSELSYDSLDAKGQPVVSTMIRYLASLGATKDSVGLSAIADRDVRRIEQGIASATRGERSMLRDRIDEVLFELDRYAATGDPSGYSLAMRIEFWKAGWAIARDHWLVGVGTGDTQRAFNEEYERMGSELAPLWRLRAHNEYLTLWISFGVFGSLWCMIAWIWPAWRADAFRHPVFVGWAIAFAISCLTDDTPETQAGATFFAFFYCLFVFGISRSPGAAPAVPVRAPARSA